MKQLGLGLNLSTKKTRKREFLEEMGRVVPWAVLVQSVEPYYGKAKTGRPPFGIEIMLRIHYLQHLFGLSDPAMEEALHDVPLYREFAKLDGALARLLDETTILRFRHLLDQVGRYACRNIDGRAASGDPEGNRSRHATADAMNSAGFTTRSGRHITVGRSWHTADLTPTADTQFLRAAHDGACRYFDIVLGPGVSLTLWHAPCAGHRGAGCTLDSPQTCPSEDPRRAP